MRKHLNTLFVTTQGAYLSKEGLTVVVKSKGKLLLRVPIHTLDGIVCFGNVLSSPFLLGFCAENDVTVSFLTERGRFLARVQGPASGNVLLRRQQYRLADDPAFASRIAVSALTGKLANCRAVLQRRLRDHKGKMQADALEEASNHLRNNLKALQYTKDIDKIRGIEGDAAHAYFRTFDQLILMQKDAFCFRERNRRPPRDKVNCLLSFLYTVLLHDVQSALESVGLDPAVGFLHRDRPGRPGLALDMMEEFRPYLADRTALSLINLVQLKKEGFNTLENGAVLMDDETRKTVLVAYQKRKQEEIVHPFIDEKVTIGILPYVQALLLARHLRGDLERYPPFIWR